MTNFDTLTLDKINMDKIDLAARQERARFIAELVGRMSQKLSNIFVSELRLVRDKALARLQSA